jgi:hypothetical protein
MRLYTGESVACAASLLRAVRATPAAVCVCDPRARHTSYVYEHHYIRHCLWGPFDRQWHVDRINDNPLDNTIENLNYLPRALLRQKCTRESWVTLDGKANVVTCHWRRTSLEERHHRLRGLRRSCV